MNRKLFLLMTVLTVQTILGIFFSSLRVIGAEKTDINDNLIVLVSDLHVSPDPVVRQNGKYKADTAGNLENFAAEVIGMTPRPAAVLILGDLVEHATEKSYRKAKNLLARFDEQGIKYYIVAGNHDRIDLLKKFFPQCAEQVDDKGNPAFYLELPSVRFAFAETTDRTGKDGYFAAMTPEAKNFLLNKTAFNPLKPIFIGGHHQIDFAKIFPEICPQNGKISDVVDPQKAGDKITRSVHVNRNAPGSERVQGWIHGHLHYYDNKISPEGIRIHSIPSIGFMDYGKSPIVGYCLLEIFSDKYSVTLITADKKDPRNGTKKEFAIK